MNQKKNADETGIVTETWAGFRRILALNLLLLIYSVSNVFSKLAAGEAFMSIPFCLYYGAVLLLLAVYALGWQQIIKRMPLTTAFANKAVTVVWGIVWGWLFFGEKISWGKGIGALMIMSGIILFSTDKVSTGEEAQR